MRHLTYRQKSSRAKMFSALVSNRTTVAELRLPSIEVPSLLVIVAAATLVIKAGKYQNIETSVLLRFLLC